MKLASIEKVKSIVKHPNADALSIVTVLGYQAIVKLDQFKVGDLVVFIQPDTVLPDAPWATFYKAKSNRVKAIKLRGMWSMGIVESLSILGQVPLDIDPITDAHEGYSVEGILGVTKYEPPLPQDISAKGNLPSNLPKTDEERYQNILDLPYGSIVDVTLKIDGSSATIYSNGDANGITSRGMDLKLDSVNSYTKACLPLLEKWINFCKVNGVNLALRGECYGGGLQAHAINPHAHLPLGFAVFNVWNFDTMSYEGTDSPYYYEQVAQTLGIQTVDMIEKGVVLTPELIKKYDEELTTLKGKPFEGVVIKMAGGKSFKVINKAYDAKK